MSRWFRHYAGMMRDDKLVRVAIRSGQTIERVVWIWGAILESAAEIDDNGRYDLDAAEIAYFLRADLSDVESVLGALQASGRIDGSRVVKWGNRQFSSDTSAERQRRYRDKKRQQGCEVSAETSGDGRVTSPSRHRDAPETELETEETPIVPLAGGRRGKTLIPSDWKAPPVSELPPRSRACAEQWTEASYQTEAEGFLLFWQSERKMKPDWRATWANRIIARHSAVMRDQKFGNAAPDFAPRSIVPTDPEEARAWWIDKAAFYRNINRDDDARRCEANAKAIEDENPDIRRNKSASIGDVAGSILKSVRAA